MDWLNTKLEPEDVNKVLQESGEFLWRVRCAALERMLGERDARIAELEAKVNEES